MRLSKALVCSFLIGFAAASSLMSADAAGTAARAAAPAGAPGGHSTPGTTIPPGAEWAAWINRDVEINLQNLPKAYTCDELWYKLHALLLAIGAREYMSIMRYNCGKAAAGGGRSPTVDLRFQTLRPVTGKDIYWANTRAINKTIELAPGHPQRLDAGDCELVRQLQGTLFEYLGTKVDASHFDCSAPPSAHDFGVTVKILERWPNPVAAGTGAGARG